jgi:hypothetical protein
MEFILKKTAKERDYMASADTGNSGSEFGEIEFGVKERKKC